MPQVFVQKDLPLADKTSSDSIGCVMVTLHAILNNSWRGSTHSASEIFQESKDYSCKRIRPYQL